MTRTTTGTGYVVHAMVVTKWKIRSHFKDVLASQDICKSFSQLLLNEVHFALSQGAKMLRLWCLQQRKGLFSRQPSKRLGEKTSNPPPERQGALGIYRVMNEEAGWSDVRGAWGTREAWGKVIGKRCANHLSAQV